METKFKLGQRVQLSAKHAHLRAKEGHQGRVVSTMGDWFNVELDPSTDASYTYRELNYFDVEEDEVSPLAVEGTPCYYASDKELEPVEDSPEPETAHESFTDNGLTVPAELVDVLTFIQRNNLKVSGVIYDYTASAAGATGQVKFTITGA